MTTVRSIIDRLTLEEKAAFVTGKDFFSTAGNERLNIPSMVLRDGPNGVRRTGSTTDMGAHLEAATCFPTLGALANSWDTDLLQQIGAALGEECLAYGVDVLLAPGINMKRTPLGGRNYEYFSEDPVLAGELGAAYIQGVQSKGVGACVKHFACNNQEVDRMTISSEVDERTMREIYLSAFERIIRKANPWMVMAAYNKVNGVYASEHKQLLSDILKEEWGFEGAVVSDWGGVSDIVRSIEAGLDLEMPGNTGYSAQTIVKAVQEGRLQETSLDEAVVRLTRISLMAAENRVNGYTIDEKAQHALARHAAAESVVLLKNEDNVLPIEPASIRSIAILGRLAKEPCIQGVGSSQVKPLQVDGAFDAFVSSMDGIELGYADGYSNDPEEMEEQLLNEAIEKAKNADIAVLFVGVAPAFQKEGRDRKHIRLPDAHSRLIQEVCKVQPRTVVVITSASAIEMPWVNLPQAIVIGWLGGQASGSAMVDVLLGVTNPGGKLQETFPLRLEDNPANLNYPGEAGKVLYGERSYIGYRYYDKTKIEPLFPFGFGLSYTGFAYENLQVNNVTLTETGTLEVKVTVRNIGDRVGKEIFQLYVTHLQSEYMRPLQELKAFGKVYLQPGEAKEVVLTIQGSDCAVFDAELGRWRTESGEIELKVGSSSRNIHLTQKICVAASKEHFTKVNPQMPFKAYVKDPRASELVMNALVATPISRMIGMGGAAKETAMLYFRDIPMQRLVNMGLMTGDQLSALTLQINRNGEE